jgi:hypothetical protein
MDDEEIRPFLAAQRHDVLHDLAGTRNQVVQRRVMEIVSRGVDPAGAKIDGKGGALDGTIAVVSAGDIAAYVPICGAYPGPKIEHPKGKDTKEGKEQKDGKESKEGKEQKDGKESKEGKESKDSKEDKDGAADGGKFAGDETQDPFAHLGDAVVLPWEAFNRIAQDHPVLLEQAIARGSVMF